MCFSASVSYSAAAVLAGAGVYAFRQAGPLPPPYRMWALIPLFFGVQQAFEGLVWQALEEGNTRAEIQFALGFHFFSHFMWLWWMPLCSYLIEPGKLRKRIFAGCAMFGAFAGSLVYSAMLFHSGWMEVSVRQQSILYQFSVPYRSSIHLPITTAAIYALIILAPLLFSSHRLVWIFGVLVALSMALASATYSYAYVSVWCFFAAVLSLYLVFMTRYFVAASKPIRAASYV